MADKLTKEQFLSALSHYLECGGWDTHDAEEDARKVLDDFLRSSGIRYGADGYSWDRQAAIVLINEWCC